MNIQIIAREGAPSTKNIGVFLLNNKEYFAKSFNFKIQRVNSQDEPKILQKLGVKMLPLIIANGKIICGEKEIKSFLTDLLKPSETENITSYDNYLMQTNSFKKVNGNIVFDDNCDTEEVDDFDKKIRDFDSKRKNIEKNIKWPSKTDVLPDTIINERVEDHEIEYENFLEEMKNNRY